MSSVAKTVFTVTSNLLAAELIFLFILFIAAKGEIGLYISFLTFTPSQPAAPTVATNAQQQANPANTAIQGVSGSGQQTLFTNSASQGSSQPLAGGANPETKPQISQDALYFPFNLFMATPAL